MAVLIPAPQLGLPPLVITTSQVPSITTTTSLQDFSTITTTVSSIITNSIVMAATGHLSKERGRQWPAAEAEAPGVWGNPEN